MNSLFVGSGRSERACCSCHTLKNEYKFICEYPSKVKLFGHCVVKRQTKTKTVMKLYPIVIEKYGNKNYNGVRAVISGSNNHLLFITYHEKDISVKLLPPQNRLENIQPKTKHKHKKSDDAVSSSASNIYAALISPHLVVLELNYDASKLRVYKNIPDAVRTVKDNIEPKCDTVSLRWGQFDHSMGTTKMTRALHRRDTNLSGSKHNPPPAISEGKEDDYEVPVTTHQAILNHKWLYLILFNIFLF
ncbi:hypothetical protein RFI_01066, partial [Reticulomyxa filosa]